MDKKTYEAPVVKKVHLEVKSAVLGVCHTSPDMWPKVELTCKSTPKCFSP